MLDLVAQASSTTSPPLHLLDSEHVWLHTFAVLVPVPVAGGLWTDVGPIDEDGST